MCTCSSFKPTLTPSSGGEIVTDPRTWDILTLEEAKDELGIVDTGDPEIDAKTDSRIQALIGTVQQWCETTVYKTYGSGTVRRVSFNQWPENGVIFDSPPLVSVGSVKYIDPDDVEQTLPVDQYVVVVKQVGQGYLYWIADFEYPELTETPGNSVTIEYTSGQDPIPPIVDQAARIMLSRYWDNHRDDVVLRNYEMAAIGLIRDAEHWGDYA